MMYRLLQSSSFLHWVALLVMAVFSIFSKTVQASNDYPGYYGGAGFYPAQSTENLRFGSGPDPSSLAMNRPLPMAVDPMIYNVSLDHYSDHDHLRFRVNHPIDVRKVRLFMTYHPSRLVVDFYDVGENVSGLSHLKTDLVRDISVAAFKSKTRVVVTLSSSFNYKVFYKNHEVVIEFRRIKTDQPQVDAYHARNGVASSDVGLIVPQVMKDVRFHLSNRKTKESELTLFFSGPVSQIKVDKLSDGVMIFLPAVTSPERFLKDFDVTDFDTVVQNFSVQRESRGLKIHVRCSGEFSDVSYQMNNRFILRIHPQQDRIAQLGGPGQMKIYTGKKLSLNFQGANIRSVLQSIADFTKMNILVADNVSGNLTIHLQNVPWDQALDIILQSMGLGIRHYGNVMVVAKDQDLLKRDQAMLAAEQEKDSLAPLVTQAFHLSYQKVDDIEDLFKKSSADSAGFSLVSKRGSVIIDKRTNQVFVHDTASHITDVVAFIHKIDIPVPQVMIEARIVEANQTFSRTLGVRLGYSKMGGFKTLPNGNVVPRWTQTGSLEGNVDAINKGIIDPTAIENNVNFPAVSLGSNFSPGRIAWTLFNASRTSLLNLELSALEADGTGRVLSNPRVVTSDKKEALIEQGTQIPYTTTQTSGGSVVSTTSFRNANLSLKVNPQITPDNHIIMQVEVNKDTVGNNTSAGIAIDTKHVKTEVLIENGGTLMIGGIFTNNSTRQYDKVPFLGDLPVIGSFFKSTVKTRNEQELLIFITPRIVNESVKGISLTE